MLPNDTPYPYDDMPEENYFGEFRELSNTIGPYIKKDNDNDNDNKHHNTDKNNPDDTLKEFSIFPRD